MPTAETLADVEPSSAAAPSCSRCGRSGEVLHDGLRDRLFDAPGVWSLRRCPSCAHIWIDPVPAAERIGDLYRSYYTHGDEREVADESSAMRLALLRGVPAASLGYADALPPESPARRLGHWLARLAPLREVGERAVLWLPAERRGRLLDVGCGSGFFLERMRALGWRVAGVEPDPRAAERARTRLHAHEDPDAVLIVKDLGDAALADESFEAATLGHVIEHLVDPESVLRDCHRLLAPAGLLAVATPNARSLGAESFGSSWIHWDPPRHLRIFDPKTLCGLVEDAGFRVRRCLTPSGSAHFVWLASTLLERRGTLPGIDLSGASPLLWLESVAFQAFEWWQTRRGHDCGEEVVVLAEKPAA